MGPFLRTDKVEINGISNPFPHPDFQTVYFSFGLEAEFLLVDSKRGKPFWHKELNAQLLLPLIEEIPFEDLPGRMDLLNIEIPATRTLPYLVEGYHIPDEELNPIDILPKGIEIRTPVSKDLKECLSTYKELYKRLKDSLSQKNMAPVGLSHHPTKAKFSGPQNKRRYDYWQWAMEVMTTYGPDINIGVPTQYLKGFSKDEFDEKLNYYAPALAALSCGSPFYKGRPWEISPGKVGQSRRTYKRSIIAPPIEYHGDEENRFEFKFFDMTPYIGDFECYFLLCLTLILSEDLKGHQDNPQRIYDLGEVSKTGLKTPWVEERLVEVFSEAKKVLPPLGFSTSALEFGLNRLKNKKTLADECIEIYKNHSSLKDVFNFLSELKG